MQNTFDVIVIGAGHAGVEAAAAAARMGSQVALITLNAQQIGSMPCNPAIGGVGKGHIVYEIGALGGVMPKLATKTYLQARMLNTKKGPAVQGLRLQIDKFAYAQAATQYMHCHDNITVIQAAVEDIICNQETGAVEGIATATQEKIYARAIIITTGTFLRGTIHMGEVVYEGGRRNEPSVSGLSLFLKKAGIELARLKTGIPPRLLKSSINYEVMERQGSDNLKYLFEFAPHAVEHKHDCFITHTNEATHEIIRKNLHRSAMYNGTISGVGPRYCPSIEDKIGRFASKTSHHVFVEPEGMESDEVYPNGISTSLPQEVQEAYVRSIVGFENAIITKPGYAVEYDFVHPNQLHHTLELKKIPGLFLAGQINGTTGYEEAAGQGIVAGINAHLKVHGKAPYTLDRANSYIGVMIDDLVTMGVDEPYRMFTSRAERRLILRQDNTFMRLTEDAHALGLLDQQMYQQFVQEKELIAAALKQLQNDHNQSYLLSEFGQSLDDIEKIKQAVAPLELSPRALLHIHAEIRYAPYIARELQEIKKQQMYKSLLIPNEFVFEDLPGLSRELQQKLCRVKPGTIAQAALIPGMTPAALSLLIFRVKEKSR